MNDILVRYKIHFYNEIQNNHIIKAFRTSEDFHILITFFENYQRASDVQEFILDVIRNVRKDLKDSDETGSDSGIAVYITPESTSLVDFYGRGTYLAPDLVVPTVDFEEIAIRWKEFLDT